MTKAEKEHLGKVASLGCIVPMGRGRCEGPAECHHIRTGQGLKRASDFETIPLCHLHHRNGGYGVAYHAGAEEWERRYGTEIELLKLTLVLLGVEDGKKI